MVDHGEGCTCKVETTSRSGRCTSMFCGCVWHPVEKELTNIPTVLYGCNVCQALVIDDFYMHEAHMQWHERLGHLRARELKETT